MAKGTDDLLNVSHFNALSTVRPVVVLTDDYSLPEDMPGAVLMIGTDAKTITLPKVADVKPGFDVIVVNIGADGNNIVTVSPNAADGVFGQIANAAADSTASGANGKDIVNTKATANKGDYIHLIADGEADWFIIGGVGIWASEA